MALFDERIEQHGPQQGERLGAVATHGTLGAGDKTVPLGALSLLQGDVEGIDLFVGGLVQQLALQMRGMQR